MLGTNKKKVSCPIPSNKGDSTYITIKEWCSPQNKGSVEYEGKYYLNLVTGNMDTPDKGLLKGTYAVGSCDYYDLVKYAHTNQSTCDTSNAFVKFFSDIQEYSQCAEDKVFECDDFIIYKNDDSYELHRSLINGNKRHPHDRTAWENLGDSANVLSIIFDDSGDYSLTLPYWKECLGSNCATVYNKSNMVVEKVESGEFDKCGNPLYNEFIFESLVDKNTDRPSLGANKPEATWSGPYSNSEIINRRIGTTVNGEDIKSGTDIQLVTSMDFCDKFEWVDTESGECEDDCDPVLVKRLCPKPIGTDENGIEIGAGSESLLLSQDAVCDKFEWVDTETDTCGEDCEADTIKQFCPKPIGVDENGNVINNGSDTSLITTDAPIAPLAWVDVEQEDCLPNCEHPTKRFLTLCIAKGLHIVDDCLEVFIDMTKGLDFNPDGSIFVKIKNGLGFTGDGGIEVVAANNSIVVDEDGVRVGQIGIDINGNPVMAGACLTTCETDKYVTAIDDTGTDTILTLRDGTTVQGPEIDNDDYVLPDSKTETVNADGSITVEWQMFKGGNPLSITIPADDFTAGALIDCDTGMLTISSSTGDDATVNLKCADCQPLAQLQTTGPDFGDYTTASGNITATPLVRSTKVYGGFQLIDINGDTTDVIDGTSANTAVGVRVPKNGVYKIFFRGQTNKTTGADNADFIRVDLVNVTQGGVAGGAGLKHLGLDHAAFNAAPLINSRTRAAELQAGDILQFNVTDAANQFNFIGSEALIEFSSNIPGEHGCPN